jgi:hypothetical protein
VVSQLEPNEKSFPMHPSCIPNGATMAIVLGQAPMVVGLAYNGRFGTQYWVELGSNNLWVTIENVAF